MEQNLVSKWFEYTIHVPNGFETGVWEFKNIRNKFMFSQSVRYDFIDALLLHFEKHLKHWTTKEPTATGFMAEQHNKFIRAIQEFVLASDTPNCVIMNCSHGEQWSCTVDLIDTSNVFKFESSIPTEPIITRHPKNADVFIGDEIIFSSTALHADVYEWEKSDNYGKDWIKTGVFDQDFVIKKSELAKDNGRMYRARFEGLGTTVYSKTAMITLYHRIAILTHPKDVGVKEYTRATFSIEFVGDAPGIVWQQKTKSNPVWREYARDVTSITIDSVGPELDKSQYRVVASTKLEVIYSNIATLNIVHIPDPVITLQPKNAIEYLGTEIRFKTAADNATTYEWETSHTGRGNTWVPSGVFDKDLVITAAEAIHNGLHVRARFEGTKTVYSISASTLVLPMMIITQNPYDVTAPIGSSATFTAKVDGADSVTWEHKPHDSDEWTEYVEGRHQLEIHVHNLTLLMNKTMFRLVAVNQKETIRSTSATLTVDEVPAPEVTLHPHSVKMYTNKDHTFTAAANHVKRYEWETSTDGHNWTGLDVWDKDLELKKVQSSLNNTHYRVRFEGTATVYSNSALLQCYREMGITTQPQDVTAYVGENAIIEVGGFNADSITWYRNLHGSQDWTKWATGTRVYLSNVQLDLNQARYRCEFECPVEIITSDSATLTVLEKPAPVVTVQPESQKIYALSGAVRFTTAALHADSYEWEHSKTDGSTWEATGVFNEDYVIARPTGNDDKHQFRARFSGKETVYSDVAILRVYSEMKITRQPENKSGRIGERVTFDAGFQNAGSISWKERKVGATEWRSVGSTSTLYITIGDETYDNAEYQLHITNDIETISSDIVHLTILPDVEPEIVVQPKNTYSFANEMLTIACETKDALVKQWERAYNFRPDTWSDIPGQTSDYLVEPMATAYDYNDCKVRLRIENGSKIVYSEPASVNIVEHLGPLTNDLEPLYTGAIGTEAYLSAFCLNASAFSWKMRRPGEDEWKEVKTLTYMYTHDFTEEDNGVRIRCDLTNNIETVTSQVAQFITPGTPEIVRDLPKEVMVYLDEPFVAEIDNKGGVCTWEQSNNQSSWNPVYESDGSGTVVIEDLESYDRFGYFRVTVEGNGSSIMSTPMYVKGYFKPVIYNQPQDTTASVGNTASFRISCANQVEIKWFMQKAGTSEWIDCECDSTPYYINVTADLNQAKFYCSLKSALGEWFDSEIATLTVV
ncbi:MAG: immunoglobulin domain-containing protein [Culicoidibacterales bacterium]